MAELGINPRRGRFLQHLHIWQLLSDGRVEANNAHTLYVGSDSHSVNMCRTALTKMERYIYIYIADCICELEC